MEIRGSVNGSCSTKGIQKMCALWCPRHVRMICERVFGPCLSCTSTSRNTRVPLGTM